MQRITPRTEGPTPARRARWFSVLLCTLVAVASLAAAPSIPDTATATNALEADTPATVPVTVAERTTVQADEDRVVERLYLEMADGVTLAATVARPNDSERHPVIMLYDPYGAGSVTETSFVLGANHWVPRGYAFLTVSIRGTGCSGGTFDQTSSLTEARDGARVVEWAAGQPWSTGKVGLHGSSYPGITQFFIAAQQPEGLAAIAPFETLGDLYRDVVYPGGIHDAVFTEEWSLALQPVFSTAGPQQDIPAGDTTCAANQAGHALNPTQTLTGRALQYPLDGEWWWSRSPASVAPYIEVPVFMSQAWQDNQVGARSVEVYNRIRSPKKLTVMNGDHVTPRSAPFTREQLTRWFDHWLMGDTENGIMEEEPVTVLFDIGNGNCGFIGCNTKNMVPRHVLRSETWPPAEAEFTSLYLREGNQLSLEAPITAEPTDSYLTPSDRHMRTGASALSYTSGPFTEDTLIAGPAELELYAAITSLDTDWYVTVSEIAADGQGTMIQRGLLRASHREVDESRSRPGEPFHPHQKVEPVPPGEVVNYRIEMLPFGHAFRAGTRLRLDFYVPTLLSEYGTGSSWGYAPTMVGSVNTVHHGTETPSRLVVPMIQPEQPLGPAPECGSLHAQPCFEPQ